MVLPQTSLSYLDLVPCVLLVRLIVIEVKKRVFAASESKVYRLSTTSFQIENLKVMFKCKVFHLCDLRLNENEKSRKI